VATPAPPPPAKVVINSFTVDPTRVERGQAATLRWSISNATDMTIDQNVGPVQSQGSRQVYPSGTTTYTLIANGPNGSDTKTATVEVASPAPPPPVTNTQPTLSSADMINQQARDAYFDYDHNDLRPDARDALTTDAELLKRIFAKDPGFNVLIEGHCDERGSGEYNLALGDRRATSAKDFLVQLGVPAERLKTISYGKEKPQCTDANEACYQKNRRAHLAPAQ
jgi:peptidoglycan-associated lipoprotein